jgi:hypothetical protein
MYAAGYAAAAVALSGGYMTVRTVKCALTHATVIAFTTLGIVVIFAVMSE